MRALLQKSAAGVLRLTGLQYWPVRVRSGVAAGARWTFFPWSAYWRSTQEPVMHEFLIGLGDIAGWSCWDLGAHYGIYGIGLARRVGPTGEVACFEPNPVSFARLERHRRMNGLTWLKPFPLAVSDESGTGELYTYGNLETTTTHFRYEGEPLSPDTKPIAVTTTSLDELVRAGRLRLPNLMKVDVEGHGHRALAGAARSIREGRPIIIMGFHSPTEVAGTKAVLDPLGYTWHALEANAPADWVWADVILRPPAS